MLSNKTLPRFIKTHSEIVLYSMSNSISIWGRFDPKNKLSLHDFFLKYKTKENFTRSGTTVPDPVHTYQIK